MGMTGKKRSREHSSINGGSEPDAIHSRAVKTPLGSQHLVSKRGISGKPSNAAYSIRNAAKKHQHNGHTPASIPAAGADKAVAHTSQNGKGAAPVGSTGNGIAQVEASGAPVLPQRRRKNKNKYRPDPEPVAASAKVQQASNAAPSPPTLPVQLHHIITSTSERPHVSGAEAAPLQRKRKNRNKFKLDGDSLVAAATTLPATDAPPSQGPPLARLRQIEASISKPPHTSEAQGAPPQRKRRNKNKLKPDLEPDMVSAAVPKKGLGSSAPVQHAAAASKALAERQQQSKRQKVNEHLQKLKAYDISAPSMEQAVPGKSGAEKHLNGTSTVAAKLSWHTVTAPPLPGIFQLHTLTYLGYSAC